MVCLYKNKVKLGLVYSMYSLYGFPESIPTRGYKLNFTEKCLNYTYYTLNKLIVVNRLSTFEQTKKQVWLLYGK